MTNQYDDAVIVALGGNQPWQGMAPRETMEAALARFPAFGLVPVKRSSWWRSKAWPDPSEPEFINGVAILETELEPGEVMSALLAIETEFGRVRSEKNAPRTLDLDLIAYGRRVVEEPNLRLPHPRAVERKFVMGPLAEIAPNWRHPALSKIAAALVENAQAGKDAAPFAALQHEPQPLM